MKFDPMNPLPPVTNILIAQTPINIAVERYSKKISCLKIIIRLFFRDIYWGMALRIGIVGTRGLPPEYGGYETFADHFVKYFEHSDFEILVACEGRDKTSRTRTYKGANLFYFPIKPPRNYSLRKIYEGLNDLYYYFFFARKCDVMFILAGLGTQLLPLVKLLNPRLRIVTNNDGIEWEREKYGRIEKILWKSFIRSSLSWSDLVIFDNKELIERFPKHNTKKSITIEYGVDKPEHIPWEPSIFSEGESTTPHLRNLRDNEYYVVVARLQKDNNTHQIIEGFLLSESNKNLLIIGDSLDNSYQKYLELLVPENAHDRVIFAGGIYDQRKLNMLRQHSFAYLHGHSAGGTNPSLLEAMVMGKAIVSHNNPFNSNILRDGEISFSDAESLAKKLRMLESDEKLRVRTGMNNMIRAEKRFTWERCFEKHNAAFSLLTRLKNP